MSQIRPSIKLSPPPALALRDELESMVIKDLLGPAGGPDEELIEAPGTRYFVGVLTPKRSFAAAGGPAASRGKSPPPEADDDPDDSSASSDPLDGDDLALGGGDTPTGDDGKTETAPSQDKALLPSSIGLTFSVEPSAKELQLTARWGKYLRIASEKQVNEKTGNALLIWKRYPHGGTSRLKLVDGKVAPVVIDEKHPEIVITGRIRKRDHHWSITLFLVNHQAELARLRDLAAIFQPELIIEGVNGAAVFHKRTTVMDLPDTDTKVKDENNMLAMLYRRQVEFAVGHGVGVHVDPDPKDPNHALRVKTNIVPVGEVPRTTPPTAADASVNPAFTKLDGLTLDMHTLAEMDPSQYRTKLKPLIDAYRDWIDREEKKIGDPVENLEPFKPSAKQAIDHCRGTLKRIEAGLALLGTDSVAGQAFQFMNRAMALQRTHSIFAARVRRDEKPDFAQIDISKNRSWYPFQLAFILLNLPGITQLDHAERNENPKALADLLWFPTGGGKTEAYLGLTAYTLGMRRLQGVVEGRSGENGVAVLMRYTLRLLTLQQFQRATTLICACEQIRQMAVAEGDDRWGRTPYRVGLWVGGSITPNWNDDADEAVKTAHGGGRRNSSLGGVGTPHQLGNCPWCGSTIEQGKHIKVEKFNEGGCRTLIYCGDKFGQCRFSQKQSPGEGLPVMVVDEEIYRRLPSLLISTVDKFAQMPWNGAVQMLFGQVNGYCERHGFRSPEIEDTDTHPKKGALPAARSIQQGPLRPPDLIIQDELHLISGPLGSLVGLYETAVDELCTWTVKGKRVRPKVVASTATIRRADDQVYGLFMRELKIFPPNGLDIRDNFFSLQRKSSETTPGRRYLGICAPGRRLKAALIRTYIALLASGQVLFDKYGAAADPWMTLVGYFNSLRELGGMKRLVDDDVRSRLRKMNERGLSKRTLYTPDTVKELTSRLGAAAIPETLDLLETEFKVRPPDDRSRRPLDVLLATNMISVGVDVQRLGLLVAAGQPKTTAEYIQATSRVGRQFPGLVCTVFNWARPRDLSHYETFEHYHSTFYKHVEALSVTPFSAGATSRGLAALLVALIRQAGTEFNANEKAQLMDKERNHSFVNQAVAAIVRRVDTVDGPERAEEVKQLLKAKLDRWQKTAQRMAAGSRLGYDQRRDGVTIPLLNRPSIARWKDFTCLNSLRDVEPMANLVLDDHHLDEEDETPEPADTQGGKA